MRVFRDQREIAEAIAEEYRRHGARVIDINGAQLALFFDQQAKLVAAFNVDTIASAIEQNFS